MLNTKVLPNYDDFKQLVLNLIKTSEDKLVDLICSQPFWKLDTIGKSFDTFMCNFTPDAPVTC